MYWPVCLNILFTVFNIKLIKSDILALEYNAIWIIK